MFRLSIGAIIREQYKKDSNRVSYFNKFLYIYAYHSTTYDYFCNIIYASVFNLLPIENRLAQ